jgi:hypothetical protein
MSDSIKASSKLRIVRDSSKFRCSESRPDEFSCVPQEHKCADFAELETISELRSRPMFQHNLRGILQNGTDFFEKELHTSI